MSSLLVDYKKETKITLIIFFSVYTITSCVSLIFLDYKVSPMKDFNEDYISFQTFIYILRNNLFVFLLLLLGTITFGILTLTNIISNAIMLGVATKGILELGPISFPILIHGIPEFLSFFLAANFGLKPINYHFSNYKKSIKICFIGFILVISAALIEAYISPMVILLLK
ncbi:stage II sporulation protein M [Bacillus sp. TL12]|uniref:stage II sporulation protein M n=1 Tax=Bacillus sp. TL12 TaxID=2894756 RepID=UPI001F518948|nr:stage II sporulation protein M [Bacillus sp. TL12]MCI0768162.1 stage II sporulation protein M [Bacillus sp. TL12]